MCVRVCACACVSLCRCVCAGECVDLGGGGWVHVDACVLTVREWRCGSVCCTCARVCASYWYLAQMRSSSACALGRWRKPSTCVRAMSPDRQGLQLPLMIQACAVQVAGTVYVRVCVWVCVFACVLACAQPQQQAHGGFALCSWDRKQVHACPAALTCHSPP